MSRARNVPHIPPSKSKDPTVDAMRQLLLTWKGETRNTLDRVVTFADLQASGIGQISSTGQLGSGGGNYVPPPPTYVTALSNLTASGGFGYIFLTWEGVNQLTYAYTEIWRSADDNLSNAILIGSTIASIYVDNNVNSGQSFYYWVRAVSTTNNPGPFNAVAGTLGTAVLEPDYVIGLIEGLISESELAAELLTPIQSIPSIQSTLDDHGIRIPTVEGFVDSLNIQVPNIQTTIDDHAARIPPLEAASANYAAQIGQLQTDVLNIRDLPSWSNGESYLAGDIVRYGGFAWRALQDMTAPSPTPSEGAFWTNVGNYTTYDGVVYADAVALSDLDTRVTTAEGSITASASDITALQVDMIAAEGDIVANAGAVSALDTRVTSAEGSITVNASDITTLNSDLATTNGNVTANANAVSALDTRVTTTEGNISAQATQITSLQASLDEIVVSEWDANEVYSIDDVFRYNSNIYRVIATQSTPNATPPNATYYEADPDFNSLASQVSANSSSISSLESRVSVNEGDITSQAGDITALQADIATANGNISGNATAITTLDGRVTTAESDITSNASAITTLQSDVATANGNITGNANAVSALDTRVTTAEGNITSNASDITQLQVDLTQAESDITANANATSLLDTRVTSAEGTVTSHGTRLDQVEADISVLDVDGNAAAISALDARVSTNEGDITALSQDVTILNSFVAIGDTAFDSAEIWHFDNDLEGWTTNDAVITQDNGVVTLESNTASNRARMSVTGLSIDGGTNYLVKARVRRSVGTDWFLRCYYSTSGHSWSASYFKSVPEPSGYANGDWVVLQWDMTALTAGATDWIDNVITGIRIDFSNTIGDQFDVDWVSIGRPGPGGQSRAVSQLLTDVSVIDGLVTSQASDITLLQSDVSDINVTLGGVDTLASANSTALGLLDTRVGTAEGTITAQGSAITQLETDLNIAEGNITGSANAIEALDTRVEATENTITAESSRLDTVEATANGASSAVQTKAEASVVTDLQGNVTDIEAQYTIKLDVNGHLAGVGLMNDGATSEFIVASNAVYFIDPGQSPTPFVPSTNYASLDALRATQFVFGYANVEGQQRFVINVPAYIQNGTITTAQIQNANVEWAQIVNADIRTADIADGTITTAKIADSIQSTNYTQGQLGWRVNKSGLAEFNELQIYDPDGRLAFASGDNYLVATDEPAEWINVLPDPGIQEIGPGSMLPGAYKVKKVSYSIYRYGDERFFRDNIDAINGDMDFEDGVSGPYQLMGNGFVDTNNTNYHMLSRAIPATAGADYQIEVWYRVLSAPTNNVNMFISIDYVNNAAGVPASGDFFIGDSDEANADSDVILRSNSQLLGAANLFDATVGVQTSSIRPISMTDYPNATHFSVRILVNNLSGYADDLVIDRVEVRRNRPLIGTTYIRDAAITNAKIIDAAVDTLKIQGNAVTVPAAYERTTSRGFPTSAKFATEPSSIIYNHGIDETIQCILYYEVAVTPRSHTGLPLMCTWLTLNGSEQLPTNDLHSSFVVNLEGENVKFVRGTIIVDMPPGDNSIQFYARASTALGYVDGTVTPNGDYGFDSQYSKFAIWGAKR